MTVVSPTWSPQQAARIVGATYLVTDATSIYGIFVRSSLIVSGDAARTASNIVAHSQFFRGGIVCDLLTGAGIVLLNLGFYTLLSPVNRNLARLGAMFRLVEVCIGIVIALMSLVVLSILGGDRYMQSFDSGQRDALAQLFVGAQATGYLIALMFVGLGSTTYMYLLTRSRYIPNVLAMLGLVGSALILLFALGRLVFPGQSAAVIAALRTLPTAGTVILGIIALPILAFEIILGLWLLIKGVRVPEQA